uniref:HAT C-terminal dimerisation domain-containing protein n=1 Tax=Panagrolaimus sp. ES5 TaxID=591445 RepID=A0AC34GFG6_9BILA
VGTQPTLHLVVPCFARLYREWEVIEDWSDEIEYSMKTAALLALKEKIPNLTDSHYFATILDPNVKKDIKSFLLPDRNNHTREIKEIVDKLRSALKSYVVRTRRYRPRVNTPLESDHPFAQAIVSTNTDSADMVVDNEINKYLIDNETYSTSILAYWKNAAGYYPYLSAFAKSLLSIPASSCPLERSFSILNKVDCKERPQLSQETITNIVLSNAMEKYLPTIASS